VFLRNLSLDDPRLQFKLTARFLLRGAAICLPLACFVATANEGVFSSSATLLGASLYFAGAMYLIANGNKDYLQNLFRQRVRPFRTPYINHLSLAHTTVGAGLFADLPVASLLTHLNSFSKTTLYLTLCFAAPLTIGCGAAAYTQVRRMLKQNRWTPPERHDTPRNTPQSRLCV
jgi:hypothetical protein